MSDVTINNLPTASTIDATQDYLPIYTASSAATQKITRNTYLGISSQPLGLTDTQSPTNKTFDNTNTITVKDGSLTLQNTSSTTKQARFSASGITAGQTRTITLPDYNATMASLAGTETFTNKTLTSPTINSPTITNATISADALTGYSASTTGTVYGISVASGVFTSSNIIDTSQIKASAVTNAKMAAASVTNNNLALSTASNNIYYNGGGSTTYTMTNSYATVTGLTTPSITVAAGVVLVIGTVDLLQASATSADVFFRVVYGGGSTAPNYPTAGEIQLTMSSATSNNRHQAAVCFLFTGVTAATYTFTAQAYCTAGTFRVDNTHTNLQVIPLNS